MTNSCFVALGSNLGNSQGILSKAVKYVANALNGRVIGCSRLFESRAELVVNQPNFLNAVIQVLLPTYSTISASDIFHKLKDVERQFEKSETR